MPQALMISLLVGFGGFAGALCRYGLSVLSQRFSFDWPIGTLAANMLGCLCMGVIMALAARGEVLSPELRLALATGFCGGFTTMSSMIYETSEMLRLNEYLHAAMYAFGTIFLSMAMFVCGMLTVRLIVKLNHIY
jgi:CrcB protein